jgi:hypothetical protein
LKIRRRRSLISAQGWSLRLPWGTREKRIQRCKRWPDRVSERFQRWVGLVPEPRVEATLGYNWRTPSAYLQTEPVPTWCSMVDDLTDLRVSWARSAAMTFSSYRYSYYYGSLSTGRSGRAMSCRRALMM